MIPTLIAVNVLVGVALIWLAIDRVTRWPAPNPRPFACATCRVDYTDARALAWHVRGQHPDTYDHAIGACGGLAAVAIAGHADALAIEMAVGR